MGLMKSFGRALKGLVAAPVVGVTMLGGVAATVLEPVLGATPAFAHSASELSKSDFERSALPNTLFHLFSAEAYKNNNPEQLRTKISEDFWNSLDIEGAMNRVWKQIKDKPAIQEMLNDARNGDRGSLNNFITDTGRRNESFLAAMGFAFSNTGYKAADRAVTHKQISENSFDDIRDEGVKAFVLNILAGKTEAERRALFDNNYAAIQGLATEAWTKAFESFVQNTIEPSLLEAPEVKAAPTGIDFGTPKGAAPAKPTAKPEIKFEVK